VDYLKSRGLTGAIAKQFDLGFAPPGWDNLHQALGTTPAQLALLKDSGMLVENESGKLYDRFRDRVVFPIRDQRGRVVAFGGRVLGDDKPKYLNSPETAIFHKGRELYGLFQARQTNRRLDRLLVVEGYMDVIALAQHGISNACATLGTATSRTHLERLYRLCPEVVFCFDGDEAGRKAAVRAMEAALPCMEDGRQARFLFLPEGEDPDSMVRSHGAEHFQRLVASATPLEQFLFESVGRGLDTSSMDGKARLSKLALPLLRQLPEGVYRQLMFQALAQRTGLDLASLMQLEAAAQPPAAQQSAVDPTDFPATGPAGAQQTRPQPRRREATRHRAAGYSNLAQAAIALLLHQPIVARLVDPAPLSELEGEDVGLLRELLTLLQRRPESNTAMLLGHWYLIDRDLSLDPLHTVLRVYRSGLLAQCLALGAAALVFANTSTTGPGGGFRPLVDSHLAALAARLLTSPVGAGILAVMIRRTLDIPQTMAATGLFYIAVLAVMVGEFLGRYLLFRTGLPL